MRYMNNATEPTMNEATKQMIRDFLSHHRGDVEATARWMRDTLRLAGIKTCRAWIAEALA